MEMLVIGVIALAAFAAVLLPLFRRRPGIGDESEFENIPPAPSQSDTATHPGTTDPSADADIAAAADLAADLDARPTVEAPGSAAADALRLTSAQPGDDAIEAEVMRYREAVRAGTVCGKCGQANPPDSAYCFECGARLPVADAKEFE